MRDSATSKEDARAISMALSVLDAFREVRADMPATHIYSFLTVALEEGLGVHEYAHRAGIPQTTMTRHLLDLGSMDRKRQPGLGLLAQRMDPADLRKHQTFLTPAGRAVVNKVIRSMLTTRSRGLRSTTWNLKAATGSTTARNSRSAG
ncbi:MAG TPA: MarR family winged helix-turn-helix transcriptional regulator [Xanthobacteraceae bacterium]